MAQEPHLTGPGLSSLPDDVILEIFLYLDLLDLVDIALVLGSHYVLPLLLKSVVFCKLSEPNPYTLSLRSSGYCFPFEINGNSGLYLPLDIRFEELEPIQKHIRTIHIQSSGRLQECLAIRSWVATLGQLRELQSDMPLSNSQASLTSLTLTNFNGALPFKTQTLRSLSLSLLSENRPPFVFSPRLYPLLESLFLTGFTLKVAGPSKRLKRLFISRHGADHAPDIAALGHIEDYLFVFDYSAMFTGQLFDRPVLSLRNLRLMNVPNSFFLLEHVPNVDKILILSNSLTPHIRS